MTNSVISENHMKYLERKALYRSFGYDVDAEMDLILKRAEPVSGRILEAGTGKGHFALALAKAGHPFVTFDISPEEQAFARLSVAYAGFTDRVDFKIADAEKTGFGPGSFDLIFSVNVLHHLRGAYRVMDELARILSSEGRLIITDFTDEGFRVMDKIHALDGNKHEVSETKLADAKRYLAGKGFVISVTKSVYQTVLAAAKRRR